eukprot:8361945-Alexandrium_andersonii.AAC.1
MPTTTHATTTHAPGTLKPPRGPPHPSCPTTKFMPELRATCPGLPPTQAQRERERLQYAGFATLCFTA